MSMTKSETMADKIQMTKSLPPLRTYGVIVDGFPSQLYSARTPAQARAACWRDYLGYNSGVSFKRFLAISSINRVPNPPGVGERVLVSGRVAIRCVGNHGHYVRFMWDDENVVLLSHPADVQPYARATANV